MKKKVKVSAIQTKITEKAIGQLRDSYRDIIILLAYEMGISITNIAKEHKLNKSTVSRIIKNNKELLSR